jgi:NitT/TauT family transport system substrate-binding protein
MPIKLTENFRAVFYAPFYATQALGFYDSEGVDVELRPSPAPAAAAADLLDGTIDLSWGGPMRVMKAREDNPNSRLVCLAKSSPVIRSFWSAEAIRLRSGSPICRG